MATRSAAPQKFNFWQAIDFKIESLTGPPTFDANKRGHFLLDGDGNLRFNDGSEYPIIRDSTTQLVNGDISPTAAIALSKLALDPLNRGNHTGTQLANTISNFDAAAVSANASAIATASTADRARANHTGTQPASSISDFDTQVRTSRLDQLAAPTTAVGLNGQRLTSVANPTAATDGANKQYVDNAISGFHQGSARAATTANITLSGTQTIDGVAVVAGDRVLVKNQTTAGQNGIYIVAAGAWTRAPDMASANQVDGTLIVVEDGAQAGQIYITVSEVTALGTDAITWTQNASGSDLTAGAGLTKSGNQFSITNLGVTTAMLALLAVGTGQLADSAVTTAKVSDGAITAIKLAVGAVDLASTVVTGTLPLAKGGTGATTAAGARANIGAVGMYTNGAVHSAGQTIVITAATHGLGTGRAKQVTLILESTGDEWEADVNYASNGDVTIGFGASQAANTWRVNILGM